MATKKKAAKPARSAKKATPKAKVTKVTAKPVHEQPLTLEIYDVQDVPEHQHFYFVSGHRARNIKELAEMMDRIEHDVFNYHVNESKNDFHSWVKGVFNDMELAEKLLGVTGPKHLQFTIYKHVADKALKKRK